MSHSGPRVAVVGVGGAGCNAVSMFSDSLCDVFTIGINTDKEALAKTSADKKLFICKEVLKGEGAQGDAQIGKKCAEIHKAEIKESLRGFDFAFVIAGLGGGTGTGALPTVLDAAQSNGVQTFAICIAPFSFETARCAVCREAFAHIKAVCPNTVLVENDYILRNLPNLTPRKTFAEVNRSIMKHVMSRCSIIDDVYSEERTRTVGGDVHNLGNAMPLSAFTKA